MMLVIGDKLALSFEQSNFTMSNIFTLLGSAILFLGLVKRNCDTYGQKNTKNKKKELFKKIAALREFVLFSVSNENLQSVCISINQIMDK